MVSFTGIGSGLDLTALIDSTVQLERLPIRQLEGKKADANQAISTIGTLVSRLKTLQAEAEKLSNRDDVRALSTVSDNEDLISANASDGRGVHRETGLAVVVVGATSGDRGTDPHAGNEREKLHKGLHCFPRFELTLPGPVMNEHSIERTSIPRLGRECTRLYDRNFPSSWPIGRFATVGKCRGEDTFPPEVRDHKQIL